MGDFFSFWWTSICESLGSSWDKIGGVDLTVTVFGGLFLFILKKSPRSKWSFHSDHPIWSEAWRLLALFIALFLITVVVYAPFQQFEKEHQAKLQAEKDLEIANRIKKSMEDDLKAANTRANNLSDALNESKDSVQGGKKN